MRPTRRSPCGAHRRTAPFACGIRSSAPTPARRLRWTTSSRQHRSWPRACFFRERARRHGVLAHRSEVDLPPALAVPASVGLILRGQPPRAEGRPPARRPTARARGSAEATGSQRPIGPEAVEPTVLAGRLNAAQEMTTRASEVERGAPGADPDDRSVRRRRKVLQAQHYRHQGRSIAEIARLLDQAPATIKAYLYDPTGEQGARDQSAVPRKLRVVRRADLGCGRQGPRLAPLPALQAAIGAAVDARAGSRRAPTLV